MSLQNPIQQNALVIFCKIGQNSREKGFLPLTQLMGEAGHLHFPVEVCVQESFVSVGTQSHSDAGYALGP